MKENENTLKSIKTIAKTASSLSKASYFLSMCVNNLAYDGSLVGRIKPDLGYLYHIAHLMESRTEGILANICDRTAFNQVDEDQFSQQLSYEVHYKNEAFAEHVRSLRKALNEGKALMIAKDRPWKPDPRSIGKILRDWRGDRYSLYAIAKEQNCRPDGLQRIEEGKEVTTTNLMHYLHFIKIHDPESDVISAVWNAL